MLDRSALPPSDLDHRDLPLDTIASGSLLYRIHQKIYGAKFFGRTGGWRFDSPSGLFGTMYAGLSARVAFSETLTRGQGSLVAAEEIEKRSICTFQVLKPLQMVKLFGASMTMLQATADVSSGDTAVSRSWAQALLDHPQQPDGIMYRSKYDNDEFALALFNRCETSVDAGVSTGLMDDVKLLGSILDHYALGLK
jgi:RES domain